MARSQNKLMLNLGCGTNKISGYINIDAEKSCKPDLLADFVKKPLPYKNDSVHEVLLFHTIEHIQKRSHMRLLEDIARVLKKDGKLYLSYPNFEQCAKNWISNASGKRVFWEATIFGRQLYPGDYHVCAINPGELALMLYECGFSNVVSGPEPGEYYNNITVASKQRSPYLTYEEVITKYMSNLSVKHMEKLGAGN